MGGWGGRERGGVVVVVVVGWGGWVGEEGGREGEEGGGGGGGFTVFLTSCASVPDTSSKPRTHSSRLKTAHLQTWRC